MRQSLAVVISTTEAMSGVHLMWLECPQVAAAAVPGQFVMVSCGEALLRRPLSIHQVDETNTRLALLFAVVGKGTDWLSRHKAGDKIDLFGPLGNGFSVRPDAHNLLLVAGGMGIAPLCFWAERAASQGHSVQLLSGARTASQLCPAQFLPAGAEFLAATQDGTAGQQGMVTDLVPGFAGWADQVYACGPMPMYRSMAARKAELGLEGKPVQISLEMRMGCGFGVCYGCTVKTNAGLKQVCKDGPVFDLADILWDELSR